MAKSSAHANQILDHLVGNTTWSAVTNLYISLHTGDPGTTGASEVAGGNYARVETDGSDWAAAASGAVATSAAVAFPLGGDDDVVTHFGVWTASTSGTFLRGGALDDSFTYTAATIPEFAPGALELSEA